MDTRRHGRVQRIGDVLADSLPPGRGPLGELARAWPRLVGDQLAQVSHPARLGRDGALVVHCADATWASELQLHEEMLLGRIAEGLGDATPTRLRFRIGPLPLGTGPPPPVALEPSSSARAEAHDRARGIADPALREAAERALAAALARREQEPPTGGRTDGSRDANRYNS